MAQDLVDALVNMQEREALSIVEEIIQSDGIPTTS